MSSVRVSRRNDQLVAVKTAAIGDATRARAEADLLAGLNHPGVIRFVEHVDGDPAELHTVYVGTDTWERTPPRSPEDAVDGLASLAHTVADLHDEGIAHGSLHAEHVLVGADKAPVLCGFGRAGELDANSQVDDMVALAGVIRDLPTELPDGLRSELDELALLASSGELSARTLAAALLETGRTRPSARRPRRLSAVGGLVALAAAGSTIFALAWAHLGADANPQAHASIEVSAPPEASLPEATPPSSIPATTSSSDPPNLLPAAHEFVHEGRRYALGAIGDIVVLGDWNCDGTETPALLQTDTDMVAIFAIWPDAGDEVAATATTATSGALGLEAVDHDDCHQLRIIEPQGSHLFTPEF